MSTINQPTTTGATVGSSCLVLPLGVLLGVSCLVLALVMCVTGTGYVTELPPPRPTVAPPSVTAVALVPTFTPTSAPATPTPAPSRQPPTPTSTAVVEWVLPKPLAPTAALDLSALAQSLQSQRGQRLGSPSRKVLAHYFAWFDGDGWSDCNISAGDRPLQPYSSDDPAAIARHVEMARQIGLDGFTLHWFVPGGRTDRNFSTLLAQSQGTRFGSTIVFSRHIYHGAAASRGEIVEALRYLLTRYGQHPNFLRTGNRSVLFFTDMYRVPTSGGESAVQFWADVRRQVDPQGESVWIAEGLDANYLQVFDGLYVFKLTHASSPADYQKNPQWGAQVRAFGADKLWIPSFGPGWDDLRADCLPNVRAPAPLHRNDRENGAFFRRTFEAAIRSDPDWLLLNSFNEWVEGSYIEPSALYGSAYLQQAEQLIGQYK